MGKESWQQEQHGLEPGREPGVLCLRIWSLVGEGVMGRRGGKPRGAGPEAIGARPEGKQDGSGSGDTDGKCQEGNRGYWESCEHTGGSGLSPGLEWPP